MYSLRQRHSARVGVILQSDQCNAQIINLVNNVKYISIHLEWKRIY